MNKSNTKEFLVGGADPYTDLANSIIYMAIADYQKAYKRLRRVSKQKADLLEKAKKYPNFYDDTNSFKQSTRRMRDKSDDIDSTLKSIAECKNLRTKLSNILRVEYDSVRVIRECESFFKSPWMEQLSGIGGRTIRNRIDADLIRKGYQLLENESESEE